MMLPKNALPVKDVFAYYSKKDGGIYLASNNEELSDLDVRIPSGTVSEGTLRAEMQEKGFIGKPVAELLRVFRETGTRQISYDSGLTVTKTRNDEFVSLSTHLLLHMEETKTHKIYVTIDCTSIPSVNVNGYVGTGKSSFLKRILNKENSVFVDFHDIDYSTQDRMELYGEVIADGFIKNPEKHFLVVDNYSPSNPRVREYKFHPTLYLTTYQQLIEKANIIADIGKTLVVSTTGDGDRSLRVGYQAMVEFYRQPQGSKFGFSFDGYEFDSPVPENFLP